MKLVTIVTAVDAQSHVNECLKWLVQNTSEATPLVLLDNGSYTPIVNPYPERVKLVRYDVNIGGNATFHSTIPLVEELGGDIVAHLHCDMMIRELNWDQRIVEIFSHNPVALAGFVGSTELDAGGGRGLGTRLNFMGAFYEGFGQATPAEVHGIRDAGYCRAAVLDHCSMVFSLAVLKQLPPQQGNFAPGHFYDRILCCEVRMRNLNTYYIGILCDHFSGGTAGGAISREAMYTRWLQDNHIPIADDNLDRQVYLWSENLFLSTYRDRLHVVPFSVA